MSQELSKLRPAIKGLVEARMAHVYDRAQFDMADWINEVRALAQSATMDGSYGTALDAYKVLGRHIGANVDEQHSQTASQHVHFHGEGAHPVKEASQEDLQARLHHIRAQISTVEDGDDDDEDITDLLA